MTDLTVLSLVQLEPDEMCGVQQDDQHSTQYTNRFHPPTTSLNSQNLKFYVNTRVVKHGRLPG